MRSTSDSKFECPALQDLHDRYETLFQASQGDAMILFMWQDDIIGVARSIDACFERVYTAAGPPVGTRHLISPELAGKDVISFLHSQSSRGPHVVTATGQAMASAI